MEWIKELISLLIPTFSIGMTIHRKRVDLLEIAIVYKEMKLPKNTMDDILHDYSLCSNYVRSKIYIRWWVNFIVIVVIIAYDYFFEMSNHVILLALVILGILNFSAYIFIMIMGNFIDKKSSMKLKDKQANILLFVKSAIVNDLIYKSIVSYMVCVVLAKSYFIDASNITEFAISFIWQFILGKILVYIFHDILMQDYLINRHTYEHKKKIDEIGIFLQDGTSYRIKVCNLSEDKECFFLIYNKERVILYKKFIVKIIQYIDTD